MDKLTTFVYNRTNGYLVLGLIAFVMCFSAIIFPHQQKQFDPDGSLGTLDLKFGFTVQEGVELFEKYGENGRAVYQFTESVIDYIYPVIYTIEMIFLLAFLFKKNKWSQKFLSVLIITAVVAMLADMCENYGIIQMLKSFPNPNEAMANFGSNAGKIKWIALGVMMLVNIFGLLSWGWRSLLKK